MSDAEANDLLERDAARVLAHMLSNIDKTAKTITVRVVYFKGGEVSPIYGSPTFMGVERYATLTISGADAKTDKGKWEVTGQLPPRL